MDRNWKNLQINSAVLVALREEGVDRNFLPVSVLPPMREVALREEGVDRNSQICKWAMQNDMSPSARRAWIEIFAHRVYHKHTSVALREEGVDRNLKYASI